MASKQPQWQYPRRHAVTGEWAEPALYWQRPPRPMYMHMRKVLANCFKMPMPVVMASGLMTYWLFLQGNTSEDDMKLSRKFLWCLPDPLLDVLIALPTPFRFAQGGFSNPSSFLPLFLLPPPPYRCW